MLVEFTGQSAQNTAMISANPSEITNFYREPVVAGGKTRYVLRSVPGLEEIASLNGAFLRTLESNGGLLYTATAGTLFEITTDGSVTALGLVDDDENTSMTFMGSFICVASNGDYQVWNGATIAEPAAGAFANFGSVDEMAGYILLTELDGARFQWSALENPESLPGLNFATAEGREGPIIRGVVLNDIYWIFKENSLEWWYPTGESGASAFERMAGGVREVGLKEFNLVKTFPDGLFFVGSDGVVYVGSGTDYRPISTPPVESALKLCRSSICTYYEDEGHKFLVIRFCDRKAWVYDISTGEWHRRAEGPELAPFSVRHAAKVGQEWYAGTAIGQIAQFKRNNRDIGVPLVRQAISRPVINGGNKFRIKEIEFYGRYGYAPVEPQMLFRISRDGGNTWGAWRMHGLGAQGRYNHSVTFTALGQVKKEAVFEFRISDAAEVPIYADCKMEVA